MYIKQEKEVIEELAEDIFPFQQRNNCFRGYMSRTSLVYSKITRKNRLRVKNGMRTGH
jgi:hypothetical protein